MPVLVGPFGDLGCALAELEPWKVSEWDSVTGSDLGSSRILLTTAGSMDCGGVRADPGH